MKKKKMIKTNSIWVKINAQYVYKGEKNESKIDYCMKKNWNLLRNKIFQIMKMKNRIKIPEKKLPKIKIFWFIKAVSVSEHVG